MEASIITKQNWIDIYADRMLHTFDKWQSPFGIDPTYIEVLKDQLQAYYDDPLKRSLIETSFPIEMENSESKHEILNS